MMELHVSSNRTVIVREISSVLNIEYTGDGEIEIKGLNLCNGKTKHDSIISYITSIKYLNPLLCNENVKAIFISKKLYEVVCNSLPKDMGIIFDDDPEGTFYKLHHLLIMQENFYNKYKFHSRIGSNSMIHETVLIEEGVIIGDNVAIGPKSIIRKGSVIGNDVIIGCGCIIGSEGFQLIKGNGKKPFLIKHVGGVTISDNVSVGDNVTICKSLFEGATSIGKNVKIDNLVHVAHNCLIGDNCVLAAGVVLSGSVTIENDVWIAPNATIMNKIVMENDAFIGIGAVVLNNVKKGMRVFGNPARPLV